MNKTKIDSSLPLNTEELLCSLKRILDIILNEDSNPGELRSACFELFDLFSLITSIKDNSLNSVETSDIYLDSGKAISPLNAARCIREHLRTTKFLRGIYSAINEAQTRFPEEAIHVLYAGCGPCAPFAVTMAALFSSGKVQFTLLDINKYSLESAKKIINALGFQNSIREYICCDASSYKHKSKSNIHIIITETMLNALQKEPQAAITGNLVPQMKSNGILIPQEITISACLIDRRNEFNFIPAENNDNNLTPADDFRKRINPVTIFKLSAEEPHTISEPLDDNGVFLKPTVIVPVEVPAMGKYTLALCTYIKVFGNHTLGDYDTSITMPLLLKDKLNAGERKTYEFIYHIGKQPGFKYYEIS